MKLCKDSQTTSPSVVMVVGTAGRGPTIVSTTDGSLKGSPRPEEIKAATRETESNNTVGGWNSWQEGLPFQLACVEVALKDLMNFLEPRNFHSL